MNKVNVGKFMKTILPTAKEYIVYAYASEELRLYGKVIVISDKVTEPTMLVKRVNSDKPVSYILPKGELREVIEDNKELIKNYIGIDAPYIGVYTMEKQRIINEVRM